MKKKNIATYWCTVQLDIFRTAVLVIVSQDRKNILRDLPNIYKEMGISEENTLEDVDLIKKSFMEDIDGFTPPGYTIRLGNDTGDVIMMFKGDNISDVSEECIVHETHHASHFICTFRGIDDEECETYIQEYMFNQLLCKIDEWNTKFKKKKK